MMILETYAVLLRFLNVERRTLQRWEKLYDFPKAKTVVRDGYSIASWDLEAVEAWQAEHQDLINKVRRNQCNSSTE